MSKKYVIWIVLALAVIVVGFGLFRAFAPQKALSMAAQDQSFVEQALTSEDINICQNITSQKQNLNCIEGVAKIAIEKQTMDLCKREFHCFLVFALSQNDLTVCNQTETSNRGYAAGCYARFVLASYDNWNHLCGGKQSLATTKKTLKRHV